MARVLWEIIIPLLVVFGLWLLIGWSRWRWQRATVPVSEWQTLTASASDAERRASALLSEREALTKEVTTLAAELEASGSAAGVHRQESEIERSRADQLESEVESARSMARRLDADLTATRRGASTVEGDLLVAHARIEELEALVASGPTTTTGAVELVERPRDSRMEAPTPQHVEPPASAFRPRDEAEPDNLQLIDGVGPRLEQFLHREGITTFAQLAALNRNGATALQGKLPESPGRIERQQWVRQARQIVSGAMSLRVVPRSERHDLKRINGVGPVLERWLHGQGIYRFADLTALDDEAAAALSSKLEDFPGRVEREEWIRQATELTDDAAATT